MTTLYRIVNTADPRDWFGLYENRDQAEADARQLRRFFPQHRYAVVKESKP
jgi:hypothetical protein